MLELRLLSLNLEEKLVAAQLPEVKVPLLHSCIYQRDAVGLSKGLSGNKSKTTRRIVIVMVYNLVYH